MDYYKWRRRIKIRAFILLLSACATGLLLLHELSVYAEHNIPVRIRYPLSEIPENQAVMKIYVRDYPHDFCEIVVNKEGRWKLYTEAYYREFHEKYGEDYVANEYYDYILENESIPWQQEKIDIDSKALEQALNMNRVKFFSPCLGDSSGSGIYWDLISPAPERRDINYYADTPIHHRHILLYMQNRFRELEEAGRQVYYFPHMYHVNSKS